MSSISKQVDSKKGFYLLQFPCVQERRFYIGELAENNVEKRDLAGCFKAYDRSKTEELLAPKSELSLEELKNLAQDLASDAQLRLSSILEGRDEYERIFKETKERFVSSSLTKAVLYTSNFYPEDFLSFSDFCAVLCTVLRNYKDGFLFGYYNPHTQSAVLGVSPEYIYKSEEGVLTTVAVAGTKLKSDSAPWTEKLIKEHHLVKNSVSEQIEVEWGPNEDSVYSDLVHLKSTGIISPKAKLSKISDVLHPTAAVGTLPKSFFNQMELGVGERGQFGGYAELLGIKTPFSLVTIRGLEWSKVGMRVCIGGGVLPESDLSEEWNELEKKWETFRKLWTD